MRKLILFAVSIALCSGISAQTLAPPIDFESMTITYTWNNFDGGGTTVIPNPQVSGINTSATVGQMIKSPGQVWGGSIIEMTNPIDFTTNKIFNMKVYSPVAGARVLLKVENSTNGGIFFEKEDTSTVANAWEELTFDFTAINTANSYQKIVLIWELGVMGDGTANSTYLFDDIELIAPVLPPLTQIDLPVTFEDPLVDYTMSDFGNNVSTMIVDPTLPTNMVMEVVKPITAPVWAGTTISTPLGFASVIPFTATETKMSVRVWSPDAGIPILLKAEDNTNGAISVETETMTTVAGQWETLVFDFSNEAAGTPALDLTNTYDLASIFFNFGTGGATAGSKTYYFDDVQMALPCTTTTSSITETALDVYNAPSGVTYTTSGIYNDTILNAAGCDSIITIDLTMSFTGISEYELGSIELYPNPSTEKITISVNEIYLAYPIMIMDQAGRVVIKSEVVALETEIDITKLESGIYYVKIGDLKAEKLVKQ